MIHAGGAGNAKSVPNVNFILASLDYGGIDRHPAERRSPGNGCGNELGDARKTELYSGSCSGFSHLRVSLAL